MNIKKCKQDDSDSNHYGSCLDCLSGLQFLARYLKVALGFNPLSPSAVFPLEVLAPPTPAQFNTQMRRRPLVCNKRIVGEREI